MSATGAFGCKARVSPATMKALQAVEDEFQTYSRHRVVFRRRLARYTKPIFRHQWPIEIPIQVRMAFEVIQEFNIHSALQRLSQEIQVLWEKLESRSTGDSGTVRSFRTAALKRQFIDLTDARSDLVEEVEDLMRASSTEEISEMNGFTTFDNEWNSEPQRPSLEVAALPESASGQLRPIGPHRKRKPARRKNIKTVSHVRRRRRRPPWLVRVLKSLSEAVFRW